MMRCDTHIHTRNSHDGRLPIAKIVDLAKEQGLCYISTTDHLDYDFEYGKNRAPVSWPPLDLDAYYKEWQQAKQALDDEQNECSCDCENECDDVCCNGNKTTQKRVYDDKNNKLTLCFGIEASYDKSKLAQDKYCEVIQKYPFDVVINSVHCVDGYDVYFKMAFLFKTKKHVYSRYLDTIYDSLFVPYQYDIVAHIGYIAHGAPYKDKVLRYADFPEKIDRILKTIIQKDKALEINFHHDMCPGQDILQRYYQLGGRKISYGSDAHRGDICKDYDIVCKLLKEIGFTHFSVFEKHVERLVEIE